MEQDTIETEHEPFIPERDLLRNEDGEFLWADVDDLAPDQEETEAIELFLTENASKEMLESFWNLMHRFNLNFVLAVGSNKTVAEMMGIEPELLLGTTLELSHRSLMARYSEPQSDKENAK